MEQEIQKPLSVIDIFEIAQKTCNIFPYSDLVKLDTVDDLFYPEVYDFKLDLPFDSNSCIILYLTKDSYGHWCILNRRLDKNNNYKYAFLDSYGELIDDQLEHIDIKYRKKSDQDERYLTDLLYNAVKNNNDEVNYNNIQLQVLDNKIATCGRYVALFLKYNKLSVEKFVSILENSSNKYNIPMDMLVTIITI